jgi:hypothetical protein
MKKAFLLVIVLAAALAITYLLLHKSSSPSPEIKRDEPLTVAANTSAFTRSFSAMLNNYYQLSDAFVNWDTVAVRKNADNLALSVDSLRLNQLKGDTAVIETALNLAESIKGEIAGLNGETDIEQKRREFYMISDILYNLIRTVRYNGATVYHMECPAAFSDSSEAYWLSPSPRVVNPYLGKNHPRYKDQMLDYGQVNDSIHFAIAQ